MHPPSVDQLARSLAHTGLPHPLLVDVARAAIADGSHEQAEQRASEMAASLLQPVINATGTLLHTNLGRAPWSHQGKAEFSNLEFDLATGQRGSRQRHVGQLFAKLCDAEAAIIVNNCAAAVTLALAGLAAGRDVAVSRGELVEIGGGFRVPDVIAQSGARLHGVGTTNRTRTADYAAAIDDPDADIAVALLVHQSNYKIVGFTEAPVVRDLSALDVPLVCDIGSGLLDAACPWLDNGPPSWLDGEPAARQTLASGADLVCFSGDKLLGGPQAGIIAGRADLVEACARHPLARAFRPGGLVLSALQELAMLYLTRNGQAIPFWRMATRTTDELRGRAEALGVGSVVELTSVPGGGTLPTVEIASAGISLDGDHTAQLREHQPPIIARVSEQKTLLDLRTVEPGHDDVIASRRAASHSIGLVTASHVISTAGHVDHGKSTLVKALTGTDPDRFAEERERGLTIDLGFASTDLPSGRTVAIIDVPGHVRFLKNMLAGVGAVDACIFVVSAVEGWMPQSEEHLRILELLRLEHGLVVLTQIDLVDAETLELAQLDVEDHVEGTFLAGAPIMPVDSISGTGIAELRAVLDDVLDQTPQAVDSGRPRLWVDRCFAAKGSGTVVTGTLTGGSLAIDDELVVDPGQRSVRVRAIQSLHSNVDRITPGNRVALNLSGVSYDEVKRGDVIVRADQWHRTQVFDATVRVLDDLDHSLSRRGAHVVYLGSGEHPAALRVLGLSELDPGSDGFVRLRLADAYPMLPGDRFVLRESGRSETIGGGEILDIDPVTRASEAKPDRSVDRVIAERGWTDTDQLELLTGERREPNAGAWVVEPTRLDRDLEDLRERIGAADGLGLPLAELDERGRALLELIEDVAVDGTHVRVVDAADALADHPMLAALRSDLFSPPGVDRYDRAEVRELVRRQLVVQSDGVFFAAEAIDQAAKLVAQLLADSPDGVTVSEIRTAWNTSRKYALPLLAHLDSTGITRRRDDLRLGGPRLPDGTA